jgi:hypothetical protein
MTGLLTDKVPHGRKKGANIVPIPERWGEPLGRAEIKKESGSR